MQSSCLLLAQALCGLLRLRHENQRKESYYTNLPKDPKPTYQMLIYLVLYNPLQSHLQQLSN